MGFSISNGNMTRIVIALLLSFFVTTSGANAGEKQGNYTAWGVDEYEFFDLSKPELAKKFKNKLCFEEGYDRVHLAGAANAGCRGYLGPVFKLQFKNNRVAGVQACFEGCKDNFWRPQFTSRKDALKYAIQGLSKSPDPKDKQKLKTAQTELAALESTTNPPSHQ